MNLTVLWKTPFLCFAESKITLSVSRLFTSRAAPVPPHVNMPGALLPRESGKLIAELSTHVTIQQPGVISCAKYVYNAVKASGYGVKSWLNNELNPKTKDKAAIDWVFVADSLNFCFWSPASDTKYGVDYGGQRWTGYWSLCAALNRALDAGIPITDPNYYSNITRAQAEELFRSDSGTEIPLLEERIDVLRTVGSVLLKKYGGSFSNAVEKCGGSAKDLLQLIVTEFPPFRDEAQYKGHTVSLYKRAQILVADVWGCCKGEGLGKFDDIEHLTMFADYRVPQVLVYFDVLKYSDTLMEVLKKEKMLINGEEFEVEIRGCSIWATELICEEIRRLQSADPEGQSVQVNSTLIDEFLWDYRREHAAEVEHIPYHHVRCIYY